VPQPTALPTVSMLLVIKLKIRGNLIVAHLLDFSSMSHIIIKVHDGDMADV
jgi:hypothetical protein